MNYKDKYLPVDPDFIEYCDSQVTLKSSGKIHFFNDQHKVDDVKGQLSALNNTSKGYFLELENGDSVRLDKIITLMGKPGPGYAEYDSYANACLTCEDLGQF